MFKWFKRKVNNCIYRLTLYVKNTKFYLTLCYVFHVKYHYPVSLHKSTEKIGGDRHGSYDILPDILPNKPIVFSFGLGDDIEAEKQIINKYNGKVYAFDPTPKVKDWIENNKPSNDFYFQNIALTNYDGKATFYFPENNEYISGAIQKENVGWQKLSNVCTTVTCNKLSTIMSELNIDKIDYLKLCVEGCEYDVIKDIMTDKLNITQIAIALCGRDLKSNYNKDKTLYKLFTQNGYKSLPYSGDGRKITFVKI